MINDFQLRHVSNEGGLSSKLEWDTKRGRDFQCLANFIYCCDGLPKQLIPSHQKMEKFLTQSNPPSATFKSDLNLVLNEFYFLATEKHLNIGFTQIEKRIAPVEFVFIGRSRGQSPHILCAQRSIFRGPTLHTAGFATRNSSKGVLQFTHIRPP